MHIDKTNEDAYQEHICTWDGRSRLGGVITGPRASKGSRCLLLFPHHAPDHLIQRYRLLCILRHLHLHPQLVVSLLQILQNIPSSCTGDVAKYCTKMVSFGIHAKSPHPASQAHLHLAPFVPPCAACCPIAPDITALALIIYWKSCQSFPGQCIARSKAVCMCITSVNPTRQMHGKGIKELYVHGGLTLTTGCTTAGVQNLQNHSLPGVCLQWGV